MKGFATVMIILGLPCLAMHAYLMPEGFWEKFTTLAASMAFALCLVASTDNLVKAAKDKKPAKVEKVYNPPGYSENARPSHDDEPEY